MNMQEIHDRNTLVESAVSAVCPIDGVVFATNDPATWTIQPRADATPEQIAAGNAALRAFDVSTVRAESGRRKRREVVSALLGKDPTMDLILRAIKKLYKEIADLKKAGGKPVRTFAEWQAETLGEFIDDV